MNPVYFLIVALFFPFTGPIAESEESEQIIGSIDTSSNFLGSNDRIVIQAFSDPLVENVVCYISRPVTGGLTGWAGVAEEKSDSSVSCRQVGPVTKEQVHALREFEETAPSQESRQVFSEGTNLFFKHTAVARLMDREQNVLIYVSYARELVDGSPKSSISVVPLVVSE